MLNAFSFTSSVWHPATDAFADEVAVTLPPSLSRSYSSPSPTRAQRAAAELAGSFLSMDGSEEFRSVLSNTEKPPHLSSGSPAGIITSRSTFKRRRTD